MRIILIFLFVITFTVGFVPAHFLNKEILSIDDTVLHCALNDIRIDFDSWITPMKWQSLHCEWR